MYTGDISEILVVRGQILKDRPHTYRCKIRRSDGTIDDCVPIEKEAVTNIICRQERKMPENGKGYNFDMFRS
jgi:hypothetical protein